MNCGIYKITNTVTNKCYIGSSINIRKRFSDHRSYLIRNFHKNKKLQRSWNKHGELSFKFEIIIICSKENLLLYEQIIIDSYDVVTNGYNISPSAGNSLGLKHTKESKDMISKKAIGREVSNESRLKMSISGKGKKLTQEHKNKISAAHMGKKQKPHSDEQKRKLSEKLRGRKFTEEHKNKISISHKRMWEKRRCQGLGLQ